MTNEEKAAAKAQAKAIAAAKAKEEAEANKAGEGAADWDAEDGVKVRCIVTTRPFTHEKGLNEGEEATVPEAIAELMLKRKQVELV